MEEPARILSEPIRSLSEPIALQNTKDILDFAEQMQYTAKAKGTIKSRVRALRQIGKLYNLRDTQQVQRYLTTHPTWKKSTAKRYTQAYDRLLKHLKIEWNCPNIKTENKLPFIPTEAELDQLIAATGSRMTILLQTLKETGTRISEAVNLKWLDIDTQRKVINVTPAKNGNGRFLPITDKLLTMLSIIPKTKDYVFSQSIDDHRTRFTRTRNRIAKQLQNPRLKAISFHTFRHWKGTMEYHKTKDIMHVKYILGHKSVTSTQIYINIEQALFLQTDENFTCKIAHNEKEELELIEAGFQHINNRDNLAFYRKRK